MARFLDDTDFIDKCKQSNRKVDIKVWIDWFDNGEFQEIENSDEEFMKLNISREVEGDLGKAILDQGTLVLNNSNGDYSPKSIASRFNVDLGDYYEFNIIPNRAILVDISVNGSEYKHYFWGTISSIDPNYDNSLVSITIEDEMVSLQNTTAPDKFYINEDANTVLEELLELTTIDYNPDMVDDIPFRITRNFRNDGSVFDAVKLIADLVWGKFFVVDSELKFINLQSTNETDLPIIDTLNDEDFLNQNYNESLNTNDLYTRVEVNSNPTEIIGDENNKQMIWSGSQKDSQISEVYFGDDIQGSTLQLTSSDDDGNEIDTKNTPILEGSVVINFGDKSYILGEGLSSIDYTTGEITFANSEDYPLPLDNQEMSVSYSYYILTLAPAKSSTEPSVKEIIAKYEDPSINISQLENYIRAETITGKADVTLNSYSETFDKINFSTSSGVNGKTYTLNTNKITLSENATDLTFEGDIYQYARDYKYPGNNGSKHRHRNTTVYLVVDGERVKELSYMNKRYENSFRSYYTGLSGGEEVWLSFDFYTADSDKEAKLVVYPVSMNVAEIITSSSEPGEVDITIEQIDDLQSNDRTKLIFRNYSDSEVALYSTYKGENYDNIYLLGNPIKQTESFSVVEENEDAVDAFGVSGNNLTLTNDLFKSEDRIKRIADFLLDYYSTPRTMVSVDIRGRGHIDLFDKITVNRDESDIDNNFMVYTIEDNFTEEGEWNQTLELRQVSSSTWDYQDGGIVSIVDNPSTDIDDSQRPPSVRNLSASLVQREAGDSGYPAIEITFEGNKESKYYNIYTNRNETGWEFKEKIREESFIIDDIYSTGEYQIKVVAETSAGYTETFTNGATTSILYTGANPFTEDNVLIKEKIREVSNGGFVSVIEIKIEDYLDEYFDSFEVYYKYQDSATWVYDGSSKTLEYNIIAPEIGIYEIKLLATDKHGNKPSLDAVNTFIVRIDGKQDKPTPANLETIFWGADFIEVTWEPNPDDDFAGYELRLDDNFGIEEEI